MNNTKNSLTAPEASKPIADLAAELGVEIEALEERLEMVSADALVCCSINVSCKSSLQ